MNENDVLFQKVTQAYSEKKSECSYQESKKKKKKEDIYHHIYFIIIMVFQCKLQFLIKSTPVEEEYH